MIPIDTRTLLALALPAAASVFLNNAFRIIDQFAVQWLGADAQAALAASTFALIGLYAVFSLFAAGTVPCVARATGAGDDELRRLSMGRALTGVAGAGGLALLGVGLFSEDVAALLGLSGGPARDMAAFLGTLGLFGLPLALSPVVDAILIATGRTRAMMSLHLLACVLLLILNPLLIYGAGLGIRGAALATCLARGVAVTMGLVLLRQEFGLRRRHLGAGRLLLTIARLGLPIALNDLCFAGIYGILIRFALAPLGPAVVAGLGIGFSAIEGLAWPIFSGFAAAVASCVGRALGAGRPDEAARTLRVAAPLLLGIGVGMAALFLLGGEGIGRLFTEDPAVLREAVRYAEVLAWSQPLCAFEALAEGVLIGAGATRAVLLWSGPLNLLRVPMGYLAAVGLGWGAAGVWWAINLSTALKTAGKWSTVASGRWRQQRF
jgi:putative MATE family efflux protein